jgi:hypothetical protein
VPFPLPRVRMLTTRARADYWDSYWIVEGLLRSELFGVANSTLQNFMDEIERFGFIPNGGRIYCARAFPAAERGELMRVAQI